MSKKRRGRKPDPKRRQQVIELRRQGLTQKAIGERLGITTQAVQQLLAKIDEPIELPAIACRECGDAIWTQRRAGRPNGPVYRLECLGKHPEATLGERLKAYRLAAHLTDEDLAERIGIKRQTVVAYENGRTEPKWPILSRFIRVFGVGLVDVTDVQ